MTASLRARFLSCSAVRSRSLFSLYARPAFRAFWRTTTTLVAKRLQLLHEIVPAVTRVGYLVNPANATEVETRTQDAENAAPIFGVSLTIVRAGTPVAIW
jgi:hypothetical protein